METKFNFNSQVCTDKNQSERLLSLGLKKETADMHHSYYTRVSFDGSKSHFWKEETGYNEKAIPAWSLHRLIEMSRIEGSGATLELVSLDQTYDKYIGDISRMIKGGYFNKEYLE